MLLLTTISYIILPHPFLQAQPALTALPTSPKPRRLSGAEVLSALPTPARRSAGAARLEAPESDAGEKLMGKVMKNDGKLGKTWEKQMENLEKTNGQLGKTWEKQMERLGKRGKQMEHESVLLKMAI